MEPDNQQQPTPLQPEQPSEPLNTAEDSQSAQPLSSTAPEIAPVNYLSQISVVEDKKFNFAQKKPMLIGIFAIICIVLAIIISILPKNVSPMTQLAARLVATNEVAVSSSANIKSSRLRSINSNLKMYFTNTTREIKPLLIKNDINIDKLGSSATSKESTTKMMENLEDARLNGVYDRTYAREMAYKLSTIITLYKQIYKNTGDKALKTYLTTAQTDISPIQVQFAEFNADNS